jgi:restriction system protein
MKVIANPPPQINIAFLEQFPGYIEFRGNRRSPRKPNQAPAPTTPETPEEVLEDAYQNVRESLSDELLTTVKTVSPQFFEQLVVDLLVSMGYGGTREGAGRAVGGSGDGGIDGVINEDLLGLDSVYIQAKRWEAAVGRPEVQKFAGALQGHRSKKGVLITTSSFTHGAEEYVNTIENKIVLIDGATLTQLMMDHNVGVSPVSSYDIKKIDSDYFLES